MWTPQNEALLIDMMETERFMWDPHDLMYHKREKRENCLAKISSALGPPFTAGMVKKKWKVMRDQYVRLAKKMSNVQKPGNEDDRSIPKWEHFNRLQFLGDSAVINDNICSAAECVTPILGMDDDMPDSAESNCSVVVEPFTLNDEVSQPAANTPVSEDSPPTQPAGNSRKKKPVRLTDQILAEALSVLQSAKESSAQGLDDMDAATQAFVKFIGINLMKVPPESKFVAQMEIMQVLHKYIKVSDRNTDEQ